MKHKHVVRILALKLRRLPRWYYLAFALVLVSLWYGISFGFARPIVFSYGTKSCVDRVTVLPQLQRSPDGGEFTLVAEGGVDGVFATKVCASPAQLPQQGGRYAALAPFGGWLFRQQFSINVPAAPVADIAPLKKPLSTTRELKLKLNVADQVFEYAVDIAGETIACKTRQHVVGCDIAPLKLAQGEEYEVELSRKFGSAQTKLASRKVTTLPAVEFISTSFEAGQVFYDKPQQFTLQADKPLQQVGAELVVVGDNNATEKTTTAVEIEDERTARITAPEELPREKQLELRLTSAQAHDGSGLDETVTLPFSTSGGPEPVEVSARGSDVEPGSTVVISFDQDLSATQDIAQVVQVNGVEAQVSRTPRQLRIALTPASKCVDVEIVVAKGALSSHDVPRSAPWKHSFRTSCYTTSVIGNSRQGRPISAYHFGNGQEAILFTGGIHGNERSSSLILHDLIENLNKNAHAIPAHRQVVVVPTINPDGYASGSRNTANNVNLNRNFATSDWQKDLQDTNGSVPSGGGETPMSEPETQAIARLSQQLMPRFVLSYHAVGSVVIGNLAGDSSARATAYASQVGYSVGTGRDAEIFDYAISGTYDDWLMQNLGVPSMIVELGSYTYRNFEHHRPAMWQIITN